MTKTIASKEMKLLKWLKTNVMKVVALPIALSSLQFLALLIQSLGDGMVDDNELHAMLQAGNSTSLFFLALVMAILKLNKRDTL